MTPVEVQVALERALDHEWQVGVAIFQPDAADGIWRVTLRRRHRVLALVVDEATINDEGRLGELVAERMAA